MSAVNLTWPRMLDKISAIVEQHGALAAAVEHKQTILSLLGQYKSSESDYRVYKHFDASGYTKNLVRDVNEGESNVIIMCWAAGQSSAFHAHEGSRCFVKVLAGRLREQQVPHPMWQQDSGKANENLLERDRMLSENDVTYIDDTIGAHRVSNVSTKEPAISLHVYVPAYRKCRIFDTATRQQSPLTLAHSKSVAVTFNSIHGKLVNC